MFARLQTLFFSAKDKRDLLSHNSVCEENSFTTVSTSDSSSEQNVEIEDKSPPLVETTLEPIHKGHAAMRSNPDSDEVSVAVLTFLLAAVFDVRSIPVASMCMAPSFIPKTGSTMPSTTAADQKSHADMS
ncbi:uncharacterized protein LOC116413444 [Galleria mellonella]|uniref:Uncharacterized protein LOC116413444 n=1 Tax=Galleria mellonella TaxID=7137 RepID=A0A6J3CBQ7_GALME|nr:uncharacterized protein LOC116413444 [Galleria mellonella]